VRGAGRQKEREKGRGGEGRREEIRRRKRKGREQKEKDNESICGGLKVWMSRAMRLCSLLGTDTAGWTRTK
jgi:hypothetical protein